MAVSIASARVLSSKGAPEVDPNQHGSRVSSKSRYFVYNVFTRTFLFFIPLFQKDKKKIKYIIMYILDEIIFNRATIDYSSLNYNKFYTR